MSVILRADENAHDEKKMSRLERLRVFSGPYLSEGDVSSAPPVIRNRASMSGKRVCVVRATEDAGVVFDRRPLVAASPSVASSRVEREKRREKREERFGSGRAPIMALLRMENRL